MIPAQIIQIRKSCWVTTNAWGRWFKLLILNVKTHGWQRSTFDMPQHQRLSQRTSDWLHKLKLDVNTNGWQHSTAGITNVSFACRLPLPTWELPPSALPTLELPQMHQFLARHSFPQCLSASPPLPVAFWSLLRKLQPCKDQRLLRCSSLAFNSLSFLISSLNAAFSAISSPLIC